MVPAADLEAHLHTEPGRYRVAMLAPPWIPVPPSGYGGTESVIALLCRALVTRGHRVTLYAAPGSRSCAEVVEPLPRSFPEGIGRALYEVDHVAWALDAVDEWSARGDPFDLIHDHSGLYSRGHGGSSVRSGRPHPARAVHGRCPPVPSPAHRQGLPRRPQRGSASLRAGP